MPDDNEKRQLALTRWGQLKRERTSWWSHWQEITTYILPRSGRYFRQDRDKGDRRNNNIYDNTGIRALRTLGAGLMGGATSPARPWFRLGTPDPDLNASQPVRLWLDDVATRMRMVMAKSNTYRSLHQMYEELGAFGTAAAVILPDFKTVVHHYPLTIGEYAIAADAQGRVCTLYREFEMPVSSLVKEFGYKNCSRTVQNLYDKGSGLDTWIPLIHAIEPRADRDASKANSQNMAWSSLYFELNGDSRTLLRESGFKQFPAVAPRWGLSGGDIYGNSPGMEALGDIKQLQHEQLRKANAIDYQTNPPLDVPTNLKNQDVNRLPGGITYRDPSAGGGIKSLFDVNLNLQYLLQDIQDVRQRINGSFFADLFMMLDNNVSPAMTATEVAERHEEKMLMIGPVLERLNDELLYPLIETTFTHMLEAGIVPPAPPDMQGQGLSVEFISVLAQAQRAIGTNGVDRFVNSLGTVAQMKPEVLDNFDSDQWAESYSDMLGVDPKLIVGSQQVAIVRQARAKAQAAQAQAAAMQQSSETAKNLGQTPTQGGASNMGQDMLNQFSGYGSPSGTEV
jgi:Bacteriophage head to tail connecting protein